MIRKQNKKYYLKYKENWKFMGKTLEINESKAFCTHIKQPDKHFFVKYRGYPINEELLQFLLDNNISLLIIPEDGKTGFKAYLATVISYINGESIKWDEDVQRVIPLKDLEQITINEHHLRRYLGEP